MKLLFQRLFSYCAMVILLSFLTLLSSLSIGMRKQFAWPQHSIHGVNACVLLNSVYKMLQEYLFYSLV